MYFSKFTYSFKRLTFLTVFQVFATTDKHKKHKVESYKIYTFLFNLISNFKMKWILNSKCLPVNDLHGAAGRSELQV